MDTENKKNEDYSGIEKFFMILLWFMQYQVGEIDLKKNGYIKKYRSRTTCIIIGIILYSIIIFLANILRNINY